MISAADKRRCFDLLNALARDPEAGKRLFSPALAWHGQHPVNDGGGRDSFEAGALAPLRQAIPDIERRDEIFIAGIYEDRPWIAATGHYCGAFAAPLFGIPASQQLVMLRYGEFYRLGADGLVDEVVTLWDMTDLMRQAGVNPLPRSAGADLTNPGPRSLDGVRLDSVLTEAGSATRKLVEAMGKGLLDYDGKTIQSMGQQRFWQPDMNWFGPCGIGATRGLSGFQDYHQIPFLTAFPDRKGGHHKSRIGDGGYCASGGWPSVVATHGGPYLGHPATGKRIGMRVMDFWRRDGRLLAENWIFIDLIDLFGQFGRDLFAEMRDLAGRRAN